MAEKSIFVLGVALLTWGGVFLYLLRLAALSKSLEAQLKSLEMREQANEANAAAADLASDESQPSALELPQTSGPRALP